jgi:hypothetical protein
MYSPKLFPELSTVPRGFTNGEIIVEPLSINHAIIDFEAVSISKERLYEKYKPDSKWPLNITLHDNIVDLGWHEKEFRDGSSFSYTITNISRSKCYGCIYIYPIRGEKILSFWLREDGVCPITEKTFRTILTEWLTSEWQGMHITIV